MPGSAEGVGAALEGYEIGGELGRGGWGVVLAGRHRQLDREVAIKQLPPEFASDPDVRARFLAEGQRLASLDHPHIVPVYDYVEHGVMCLLVMERRAEVVRALRRGHVGSALQVRSASRRGRDLHPRRRLASRDVLTAPPC